MWRDHGPLAKQSLHSGLAQGCGSRFLSSITTNKGSLAPSRILISLTQTALSPQWEPTTAPMQGAERDFSRRILGHSITQERQASFI